MTTNEAKLPFFDLPREDQDRIAGAIARGEGVQWWVMGKWQRYPGASTDIGIIYRIPPAPKPAKNPQRPRPAHKLGLKGGDVVRHVGWQDGRSGFVEVPIVVGRDSEWAVFINRHIDNPLPKGQRPLFVVVSRAKGGEA